MEHAGFDGLHNPFGAMLVCVSLLLLSGIITFGAFMVKMSMKREKAFRAEMRAAQEKRKHP